MFFEMLLPVDYEIISNKHIIERDRVVEEKTLELKYSDVNFNKSIVNNKTLKENSFSKAESMSKFQQLNFKYANPFFVNLTKEQKANLSKIIDQKDLKHLVLQTYSNDNEIAIKRLEKIYDALPPKLRVNTIYKQDLCYEGNPCNTTNIKLIY
ncbi:hypothetical protein [Aliarcobacter cryaerophilus]|jgi:hypothetical protein|uniref:hypothetical protein n=1 Tax=Aliarcobacter cryaerophilus TaxID=28198 RepID=UPI003DA4E845